MPRRPFALVPLLLSLAFAAGAGEVQRFRIWMAGQEVGGREVRSGGDRAARTVESREWSRIARLGTTIESEVLQKGARAADGTLRFTWSLRMSAQPMEGEASWSPVSPARLTLRPKGGDPRTVDLPPGTQLWPEDLDAALREAARLRRPVHLRSFSLPLAQPTEQELVPVGPDPLPGFPDAVRFRGRSREGQMTAELDVWISPTQGEVKEEGSFGGIAIRVQRAELPAPGPTTAGEGFFEGTLQPLPPHPFLPWLPEATLRWEGTGQQQLPEDAQQRRTGEGRYHLVKAAPPSPEEAAERPVKGAPHPEDAPFLAPTSLLQFRDPAFDGLIARLRPRPDAPRWELARQVTRFVFEWIEDKDFSVGFASALEVARTPRGDCTEHGTLAVALLRRLGVPARGVVGWVAAGEVMGLHLWVEVKLGTRWVPVDPTFDEAPASTLHLKLGTTDLSDLGSVGWDTALTSLTQGRWAPEGGWPGVPNPVGERACAPGGPCLRLSGGGWSLRPEALVAHLPEAVALQAAARPSNGQLRGAVVIQDAPSGRKAWWLPSSGTAYLQLAEGRWVRAAAGSEALVRTLLERLSLHP